MQFNKEDIVGHTINDIKVVLFLEKKGRNYYYICKCPQCKKDIRKERNAIKSKRSLCEKCSEDNRRKPRIDIEGKKFGKLLVEGYEKKINGRGRWKCICDCGVTVFAQTCNLLRGDYQSCGCSKKGKGHPCWEGYGDISKRYWSSIILNAKNRNIDFEISISFAWDLFLKQKKKCKLSSMDIDFKHSNKNKDGQTASLDRIDSSIGYVEGNVQWIHKDIDLMKNKFSQDYFISICKEICKNNS